MIIEVEKAKAMTFRFRAFSLTIEPYEWASGKTTVHLTFEGRARIFDGLCRVEDEIKHDNHLIVTGPEP
jgi:hypothetical protein